MKRNLKELTGYHIGATDGEIGKVTDFLFNKNTWTIHYAVVETGNWLLGRKVLLSTQGLKAVDHENKIFKVNLTTDQVKNSPDIDTNNPVGPQQESDLHQYWSHDMWPGGIGTVGMIAQAGTEPLAEAVHHAVNNDEQQQTVSTDQERRLYSIDNVKDYTIAATDGDAGKVEDFIIDDSTWKMDALIIDTGKWLSGKKVILSPQRVKELDWLTSYAKVDITTDAVKQLPEYNADEPNIDSHKTTLGDYDNETTR